MFNRTTFGRRDLVGTRLVEGLANQPSKIIYRDTWMEQQRIRMRFHIMNNFNSNRGKYFLELNHLNLLKPINKNGFSLISIVIIYML